MATANPWPEKHIILIRRLPHLSFSFADRLIHHFTLLEPLPDVFSSDLRRFLGSRAADIRLVICVGPCSLDADAISCLPSLECVLVTTTGVDLVDLAECRRRQISVANNGGAFSEDVADYAVGLLVDVLRKISAADRLVRANNWPVISGFPLGSKLGGKRVGIVGLGSIGTLVAKRLVAFGCKVSYTSRNKKSSAPYTFHDSIQSLAQEIDVIILCCALTDQTRHIVNREVMALLGEGGVIINIGRGALIDEKEMVRFLVEGKIGGAGLDVFENEPRVPSELFGLENVVMSPHCAMITPESFKAMEDVVVGNVEAFFANKPLLSLVPLD